MLLPRKMYTKRTVLLSKLSKNLISCRYKNNFVGPSKYVERLSVDENAAKSCNNLSISLNVLYNYLLIQTKLFSNL